MDFVRLASQRAERLAVVAAGGQAICQVREEAELLAHTLQVLLEQAGGQLGR